MAARRLRLLHAATPDLLERFAAIRAELGVPAAFPADVLAAAQAAAAAAPLPDADLTDLPFVTVDPPGSTDLDQAMCLSRDGSGYRVDYAIADVPGFVPPDGPVAAEALRRGQTLYAPDGRTPLHPPVLSEHAASLLPGVDRPAFVWRFELDAEGRRAALDLVLATIRSRRQLTYPQVQAAADTGGGPADVVELAGLLREIGERRIALERQRGGANLPRPEQEVVPAAGGGWTLRLSPPLPSEDWNAQLSLLTGMAAAELMLKAGIGVLRTMPPPQPGATERLRAQAAGLGVGWPVTEPYGDFLRRLDATRPAQLALLYSAGALFRGAGYAPFEGSPPEPATHAAVAAPYAHVTAPLRRLVDRFGLAACHAIQAGREVPDWVRAGLPLLPAAMTASDRLAGELDRRCLDTVEAAVLSGRTGEVFAAVVVEVAKEGDGGRVQLLDPPVVAHCSGRLELGAPVRVRLAAADPVGGTVTFEVAAAR